MMKSRIARMTAATLACLAMVGAAVAQSPERLAGSRVEAGTFFGVMIAGKDIGQGVNATGGHEKLIATLNHGFSMGVRVGVHNSLIGVEANVVTTSNPVRVSNEFGAAFPNHGERPLISSGDALLYPFRRAIRDGRVRPYVTTGIGGLLYSADLDNIKDQEKHARLSWNAGGGVKVFAGNESDLYLDFRFTKHRLLSARGLPDTDLRSATVGIGYRF